MSYGMMEIGGSVLGSAINNWWADERQEDSQTFAAQQQQIAQQFNSAEAATNRDFQERMSGTSHQREVKDLIAAGLNPMLTMMRNGAPQPSGGQAAIGGASSGIASPGHGFDIPGAMQTASNIRLQDETANKTKEEAERAKAETDEIRARTPTHAVSIEQMQQNIKQSIANVGKILQETSTSASSAKNLDQQTINLQEIIPQIRATIEQLRAHTKLASAQTTLAGAQTTQAHAQTALTGEHTRETTQRITANLPALEAALKNLERVQTEMHTPRLQQDESVAESFIGSLSATMRALNPFANIMPTIGIRGTGAPAPQPGRKDWKK